MKTFLFLFLVTVIHQSLWAQSQLPGYWEGVVDVGVPLHIGFSIERQGEGFISTISSPDQGVRNVPCSGIVVKNDSVVIDVNKWNVHFKGRLTGDNRLSGIFIQRKEFPLSLERKDKPSEKKRPQQPVPPFPYNSEDIVYSNPSKSIHYGATITTPVGAGPFPAVILITGSGIQNRDEEIMGHKPFAVIADYLTKNGYVVMRIDDRGAGQTTGDPKTSTSKDFANDVTVAMDYLESRKTVNTKKIGLLGHSEGGMIAPMVASVRKDVDFIILLAGPGVKITEVMEAQSRDVLLNSGRAADQVQSYLSLYNNFLAISNATDDDAESKKKMELALADWRKNTPATTVLAMTNISNDSTAHAFVNAFFTQIRTPWFKNFLRYDPAVTFRSVTCKVLALNGSKDIQVDSKLNLDGIRKSMVNKPGSKLYDVQEFEGLNHLFQHCHTCTIQEYGDLDETFSPGALEYISNWLNKNVK